ncbi:MAG: YtxH domain-containing protein [Hydrogenibacillus schlegelii]|uniref:YtxH domain-containing protein n=1 Tax=Hydrogenibacillus schlegelii TaxID=1484 RepID=A0A947D3A3_HYDSH|nr:YtxH domain-containing protein [Hydrogenibacillus schlegelii]
MCRADDQAIKGWIGGALIGAFVGAATCLFLTPKRGEEMREEVKKVAGRVGDAAQAVGETIRREAEALASRLRRSSRSALDEWTAVKDDFVRAVEASLSAGKDLKAALEDAAAAVFDRAEAAAVEVVRKVKAAEDDDSNAASDASEGKA